MIIIGMMLLTGMPADTDRTAALQRELHANGHPRMRWGDISDVRDVAWQGYAARGWRLYWTNDGKLTLTAVRMLSELDSARLRGLDPADYDVALLHARADSLPALDQDARVEFDVILSVAVIRHATALARGRIDPRVMYSTFEPPADEFSQYGILDIVAATNRPDTVFRNLEPQHATYQRLIELLARYRALPADSAAVRVRQIALALERWRWLPHSASAPWIVVNVPAFELYALASDREEPGDMIRMKVVTGQAAQHPTPLLITSITAVQFHPPWLLPQAIALREIRPPAMRDHTFLTRNHYQLLAGDSVVAATHENVTRIGTGIDVRQEPGPWNALGEIKFVTPNGADIFLHDTPARQDFDRTRRDFSHGCIRVADAMRLAEFALLDEPEWDADRIAEARGDSATRVVVLRHPVPVFVLYATITPGESGGVIVYHDVYGYDTRLDALLLAGYPYRRPPTP